jgi:hypothetical protein
MPWIRDPNYGGITIPAAVKERTKKRLEVHAKKHYDGKYTRLNIRFRGKFCYIDAYTEPDPMPDYTPPGFESHEAFVEHVRNIPTHLGRLRYFGDEEAWSYAFYKYSDEKYELCIMQNGDFYGTPEDAFDTGAVYLQ